MSDDACYADDIGDYRWEGFPLEVKYGWMQNATGSAAIQPGVDALRGLSARYAQSHQSVQAGLAKLGVSWQGQSADAAGHAITRLADWVGGPGQTTSGGGTSLGTYGASFNAMRPQIVPAPAAASPLAGPGVTTDGAGVLAGYQSPFSLQLEQVAAADARANAALRAHQRATRDALGSFPVVAPPPEITAGSVSTEQPAGTVSSRATPGPGRGSVAGPRAGGAATPGGGGTPKAGGAAGSVPATAGAGQHGAPAAGAPTGSTGGAGARPAGGGTTSAGAGAPPVDAGWTPLAPAAPNAGSGGLVTGPNGGLVPASIPPPYRSAPGIGSPTGLGRYAGQGGGFGPRAVYGEAERTPPLAPRTGSAGPRPQFGGDFGVPQSASGRAAGHPGGAPMGMGGAGAHGGQERTHRNQTFIPSDEPFRVEFFGVTPPVLGVRDEEAW